jgi:hypothetical protein
VVAGPVVVLVVWFAAADVVAVLTGPLVAVVVAVP